MSILQAVLHRTHGHRNRIRSVFEAHAIRHHGQYPPNKLRTKKFIELESHALWYYGIPIAVIAVLMFFGFGLLITIAHLIGVFVTFAWHVYLHRQYHVLESPLDRFTWFERKRQLHFIHHRDARVNFAVVEFWIDSLMGTRRDRDPALRPSPHRISASNAGSSTRPRSAKS
jgi:sterol desaturase/sphingolipid hydroxylase (fatty acid hydroxylase superfamily)